MKVEWQGEKVEVSEKNFLVPLRGPFNQIEVVYTIIFAPLDRTTEIPGHTILGKVYYVEYRSIKRVKPKSGRYMQVDPISKAMVREVYKRAIKLIESA